MYRRMENISKSILFAAIAVAMLLVAVPAFADVPVSITQQGRLLDANGDAMQGSQTLEFALYDSASGGTLLWSDSVTANVDEHGVYSVTLGDSSQPIDAELLSDGEVYLSLTVSGEEFSPRLELTSVPFASLAQTAEVALSVADGAVTSSALAPGAVTSTAIDSVGWSQISDVPSSVGATYDGSDFATSNQSCSGDDVAVGISSSGQLICDSVDAGATYSAGTGLSLSGGEFSIDSGYFSDYLQCAGASCPSFANNSIYLNGDSSGSASLRRLSSLGCSPALPGVCYTYLQLGQETRVSGDLSTWSDHDIYTRGTGDIISSGQLVTDRNDDASFAYVRFRGDSGTGVPRLYHSGSGDRFFLSGAENGLMVSGDLSATGSKPFIQPHPTDPSLQIRYVALEGGENGVYSRGAAVTEDGVAVIDLPDHFSMVTADNDDITVTVTPRGQWAPLYVESVSPSQVVVALDDNFPQVGDVEFDYHVQGVRAGLEDQDVFQPNTVFTPEEHATLDDFARQWAAHPHIQRLLISNGTLNEDGSVNERVVRAMGWTLNR